MYIYYGARGYLIVDFRVFKSNEYDSLKFLRIET